MKFSISTDTYRRHILRATSGSGYFLFFRHYCRLVGKLDALFLQDLVNREEMVRKQVVKRRRTKKVDGDFFQCTSGFLENPRFLVWTEKEQRRAFTTLTNAGLITTRRQGVSGTRFVRINYELIQQLLDETEDGQNHSRPKGRNQSCPKGRSKKQPPILTDKKNKLSRFGSAETEVDGESMAFFPDMQPQQSARHNAKDISLAATLHSAVVATGKRRCSWSRTKWAKQFALLRKELEAGGRAPPDARSHVESLLAWYCPRIGQDYIPEIRCAKTFRLKFSKLEAAAKRHQRDNPDVTVTDKAKEIATWLGKSNSWPKGSREQLPVVVQLSLTAASAFLKKLSRLPAKSRLASFLGVVRSRMGTSERFAQRWVEMVYDRVTNWNEWSGNLLPWVFTPDHKMFTALGRSWAQEYSGGTKLWDLLTETLNGEEAKG